MLEIKISVATAANLLLQRMRSEFDERKKIGLYPAGYDINMVPFSDLTKITEAAIFDLIVLLPAEIFMNENNLTVIITGAVRTLAKELNRDEFVLYDEKNALRIVNLVGRLIKKADKDKSYLNN